MDIRIVNTCTSDCIYCLEQSLRKQKKYKDTHEICKELARQPEKNILSFYGGNPLMHPDLLTIIRFAKRIGYANISLLTNTE